MFGLHAVFAAWFLLSTCLSVRACLFCPQPLPPCSSQPKEMALEMTGVFVENSEGKNLKFVSPFCFCGQRQDAADDLGDVSARYVVGDYQE